MKAPVGLAAFAAAAIAKSDPIKTGIQGFTYDIRTALLPFLFIFNTELLLIDVTVTKAVFVFVVAVMAWTAGLLVGNGIFYLLANQGNEAAGRVVVGFFSAFAIF